MMTSKTAFLVAALLGATAAMPLATASAESPNTVDNQTFDTRSPKGSTGTYDNLDQYKDSTGYPLPGYGYLFATPN